MHVSSNAILMCEFQAPQRASFAQNFSLHEERLSAATARGAAAARRRFPAAQRRCRARLSNNRADGGWRLFAVRRCRSYAWSRTGQCASSPRTVDFQVLDRNGRILIARPCIAEIGEIRQEIGVPSQRLVGCTGLSSLCWGRHGRRTYFCGSRR